MQLWKTPLEKDYMFFNSFMKIERYITIVLQVYLLFVKAKETAIVIHPVNYKLSGQKIL